MSEPTDPNEKHEDAIARTPDAPPISHDDAWGERQNPVREAENVATNLKQQG